MLALEASSQKETAVCPANPSALFFSCFSHLLSPILFIVFTTRCKMLVAIGHAPAAVARLVRPAQAWPAVSRWYSYPSIHPSIQEPAPDTARKRTPLKSPACSILSIPEYHSAHKSAAHFVLLPYQAQPLPPQPIHGQRQGPRPKVVGRQPLAPCSPGPAASECCPIHRSRGPVPRYLPGLCFNLTYNAAAALLALLPSGPGCERGRALSRWRRLLRACVRACAEN